MNNFGATLRKYETAPAIVWGSIDCVHMAADCAQAAGRRDLRALIPQYDSEVGAIRTLRKLGFASLLDLMDAHATPIKSARARPGDVTFHEQKGLGALGVVVGCDAVFMRDKGGLWRAPHAGRFVWRV